MNFDPITRYALKTVLPATERVRGMDDDILEPFLERVGREAPPMMTLGLVGASWILTFSPILTIGVPLPAFMLPKALLEKHLNRAASHPLYPLRLALTAIKTIAGMCWGADPEVREALGLPPHESDPSAWKGAF